MKRKEVVGLVGLVGLVPSQPPMTKWLDPTLQKGNKKKIPIVCWMKSRFIASDSLKMSTIL